MLRPHGEPPSWRLTGTTRILRVAATRGLQSFAHRRPSRCGKGVLALAARPRRPCHIVVPRPWHSNRFAFVPRALQDCSARGRWQSYCIAIRCRAVAQAARPLAKRARPGLCYHWHFIGFVFGMCIAVLPCAPRARTKGRGMLRTRQSASKNALATGATREKVCENRSAFLRQRLANASHKANRPAKTFRPSKRPEKGVRFALKLFSNFFPNPLARPDKM